MGAMASQITRLTIVNSTVYSGADQRKTSKLRVTCLCAGNSPVTSDFPAQMARNAEMFQFDDVIMTVFIAIFILDVKGMFQHLPSLSDMGPWLLISMYLCTHNEEQFCP